jgi:hypothetical protein
MVAHGFNNLWREAITLFSSRFSIQTVPLPRRHIQVSNRG